VGEGAEFPSNTMSPGPRPTSVPSGILIHQAVRPQQTSAKNSGAVSPSKTMWSGPRPTSLPSGILIYPALCLQQTWAENWGLCAAFLGGAAGSPSKTMSPGPSSTSIPSGIMIQSGILIHPAVCPQQTWAKNWGLCPFQGRGLGRHVTQCGQGRSLPPYQLAS